MSQRAQFQMATALLSAVILVSEALAEAPQPSAYRWKEFRSVAGQPEPIPVEWLASTEGAFAHSLRVPNSLPKTSGYRRGMSREEYFQILCRDEAGEFVFRTVDSIEGFYFMRPPSRPTDVELQDRYVLEAPELERFFQLLRPTPAERSIIFIFGESRRYRYIEEPARKSHVGTFVRAFGFSDQTTPKPTQAIDKLTSRYGLTWRGIRRSNDRELGISGAEWIVLDTTNGDVLAVMRTFGLSPNASNTPDNIWWLNARQCSGAKQIATAAGNAEQLYGFVSKVLKPKK